MTYAFLTMFGVQPNPNPNRKNRGGELPQRAKEKRQGCEMVTVTTSHIALFHRGHQISWGKKSQFLPYNGREGPRNRRLGAVHAYSTLPCYCTQALTPHPHMCMLLLRTLQFWCSSLVVQKGGSEFKLHNLIQVSLSLGMKYHNKGCEVAAVRTAFSIRYIATPVTLFAIGIDSQKNKVLLLPVLGRREYGSCGRRFCARCLKMSQYHRNAN